MQRELLRARLWLLQLVVQPLRAHGRPVHPTSLRADELRTGRAVTDSTVVDEADVAETVPACVDEGFAFAAGRLGRQKAPEAAIAMDLNEVSHGRHP